MCVVSTLNATRHGRQDAQLVRCMWFIIHGIVMQFDNFLFFRVLSCSCSFCSFCCCFCCCCSSCSSFLLVILVLRVVVVRCPCFSYFYSSCSFYSRCCSCCCCCPFPSFSFSCSSPFSSLSSPLCSCSCSSCSSFLLLLLLLLLLLFLLFLLLFLLLLLLLLFHLRFIFSSFIFPFFSFIQVRYEPRTTDNPFGYSGILLSF